MTATLILRGGKVLDGHSALAISGTRIAALGDDAAITALAGPETEIVELAGRRVVPGLIDGHAHMDREGLKTRLPSLAGCRSIADIQSRIADIARTTPPGEWIVTMPVGTPPGYEDAPDCLAEGRFPDRHDLDAAAPDHPVYIRAIWGYWRSNLPIVSVANSAALRLCGVDRDTAAPAPSVEICRDASGAPTGVFVETNKMPVVELTLMRQVPNFTGADRVAALAQSMADCNRAGTPSVFEGMASPPRCWPPIAPSARRGGRRCAPGWCSARPGLPPRPGIAATCCAPGAIGWPGGVWATTGWRCPASMARPTIPSSAACAARPFRKPAGRGSITTPRCRARRCARCWWRSRGTVSAPWASCPTYCRCSPRSTVSPPSPGNAGCWAISSA